MTKRGVELILAYIKAAYPRAEVHHATVAVWADVLADLTDEQGLRAVRRAVAAGGDFPPGVGKIRQCHVESQMEAIPAAELAWAEVERAICGVGHYRTPIWSSPYLARAVDSIGWASICHSENLDVTRAHFYRAYKAAVERREKQAMHGSLEAAQDNKAMELVGSIAKQLSAPRGNRGDGGGR